MIFYEKSPLELGQLLAEMAMLLLPLRYVDNGSRQFSHLDLNARAHLVLTTRLMRYCDKTRRVS